MKHLLIALLLLAPPIAAQTRSLSTCDPAGACSSLQLRLEYNVALERDPGRSLGPDPRERTRFTLDLGGDAIVKAARVYGLTSDWGSSWWFSSSPDWTAFASPDYFEMYALNGWRGATTQSYELPGRWYFTDDTRLDVETVSVPEPSSLLLLLPALLMLARTARRRYDV